MGVHKLLDGSTGDGLANHYEELQVFQYDVTGPSGIVPTIPVDLCALVECNRPCLGCEQINPPAAETCDVCGLLKPGLVTKVNPPPGYVGLGTNLTKLFGETGERDLPSSRLSPGLRNLLATPGNRFVRYSESNGGLGHGYDGPQAIIMSSDGLSILEQVFSSSGGLATRLETFGRGIPPRGLAATAAKSAAATLEVAPALVYSRSLGFLYRVGGLEGGAPRAELQFRSIADDGEWQSQALTGVLPGKVLTATWSQADGDLWLIDEIADGKKAKTARLIRIDPTSGRRPSSARGSGRPSTIASGLGTTWRAASSSSPRPARRSGSSWCASIEQLRLTRRSTVGTASSSARGR